MTRLFSGAADKRKATGAAATQWWSHADLLEKNGKPGHDGASNDEPGYACSENDAAGKDDTSGGAADNRVPLLKVEAARKAFGGLVAVNDISFCVDTGQIVGLIGPNGAGKSTTFNLITGVTPLKSASAQQIARLGIARSFQHTQLLPQMSVLENVALGAHLRCSAGAIRSILRLDRREEAALLREAAIQLERVGLGDCLFELAGNLSLGKQRIVEVARALALDPTLLLLDEPAAGLRYMEKQELAAVLSALRDEGMSILLVEHDMDFVMKLTSHLVVMDFGTKIAEGTPSQIQQNDKVLQAYLGGIDETAIADEINVDTAKNIGVRA